MSLLVRGIYLAERMKCLYQHSWLFGAINCTSTLGDLFQFIDDSCLSPNCVTEMTVNESEKRLDKG